jgi:S1-C subfamily serine protease
MRLHRLLALPLAALYVSFTTARAEESHAEVAKEVNQKLVKLYGSGGFKGLASYGSGIVVSADGYILTIASHILDTQDLRVHTHDGHRLHAKVVVIEPELDIALCKIIGDKIDDLPFFDVAAAAKKPIAAAGTNVLAFSNQFQIATLDEPMSVQRGVVAAYAKMSARKGVAEAPYNGEVYFSDAITNNPGAAGGAFTNRKGELLGIIGKELKNVLSETWVNYAMPIQAKIEIHSGDETRTVSILEILEKKEQYKPAPRREKLSFGGFSGITLVPNVVERTPPYVEEVTPNSPASKAGVRPDDLIVYVDGLQVVSIKDYKEIVDSIRPDTEIKLEVRRGDKLTTLTLKLDAPPKKPK